MLNQVARGRYSASGKDKACLSLITSSLFLILSADKVSDKNHGTQIKPSPRWWYPSSANWTWHQLFKSTLLLLFYGPLYSYCLFTEVIWGALVYLDACNPLARLWVQIRLLIYGACHPSSVPSQRAPSKSSVKTAFKRVLLWQFGLASGSITLLRLVKTDYSVVLLLRILKPVPFWLFMGRCK